MSDKKNNSQSGNNRHDSIPNERIIKILQSPKEQVYFGRASSKDTNTHSKIGGRSQDKSQARQSPIQPPKK